MMRSWQIWLKRTESTFISESKKPTCFGATVDKNEKVGLQKNPMYRDTLTKRICKMQRAIPFAELLREAVMHFNPKARALLKFGWYKLDCFWLDLNCRFYVYIFVSLECQALPDLFH